MGRSTATLLQRSRGGQRTSCNSLLPLCVSWQRTRGPWPWGILLVLQNHEFGFKNKIYKQTSGSVIDIMLTDALGAMLALVHSRKLIWYLEWKHPCLPFEYSFLSSMMFFCDSRVLGVSLRKMSKTNWAWVDFTILLDIGLPTSISIFSGPKGQNWKISVPISKRITWGLQNSPYFYS